MQDSWIDVIIPYRDNYRRLTLLVDELTSIKNLGKIIVVRDHCSSPPPALSDKAPLEIIENLGIPGALSARFSGVHHSKADYILFFDSDDTYIGGDLCDLNFAADVLVSDYIVNNTLNETKKFMELRLFAHNLTLVPFSGLIVKRQALLDVEGLLDLSIKSCQDDFLIASLMFGGKSFDHSNSTIAHITTSSDSISVRENRFKDIQLVIEQFRSEIISSSLYGRSSLLMWKLRLIIGKLSPKVSGILNRLMFSKFSF